MVFFADTKLWVVAAVGHCRAADPVAQPARNGLPLPFHSGPLISVGRNNALEEQPCDTHTRERALYRQGATIRVMTSSVGGWIYLYRWRGDDPSTFGADAINGMWCKWGFKEAGVMWLGNR